MDHCPADTGTNKLIIKDTLILIQSYSSNQQTALFNNKHKHSKLTIHLNVNTAKSISY